MEGYELFGAKTKFVDFQFYDYEHMMERELTEKWMENQDLLDQAQTVFDERFLELTGDHELVTVLVTYPQDTDMEAVLNEMRKNMERLFLRLPCMNIIKVILGIFRSQ